MTNEENILKLYELNQRNSRWMMAFSALQGVVTLIMAAGVLSSAWRRKKPDLATQLLLKKKEIKLARIRYQALMAKLNLEMETLQKQAELTIERSKFEVGIKINEVEETETELLVDKPELPDLEKVVGKIPKGAVNSLLDKLKNKYFFITHLLVFSQFSLKFSQSLIYFALWSFFWVKWGST